MLKWYSTRKGTLYVLVESDEVSETTEVVQLKKRDLSPGWKKLGEDHLGFSYEMIGSHPVFCRRKMMAYLFPGSQTDIVDGAPIVCQKLNGVVHKPAKEEWCWMAEYGVLKIYLAIEKAKRNMRIASDKKIRHLDWYNARELEGGD